MSKKAKKHWMKNVAGALVIPVFAAVLLQGICMANGRTMIVNMVSFDNFMVYTAIVMITTIALSVNLNSGRFDFSLGSMAILSSVLGAKISYGILGGGSGSALLMLILTIIFGMLLGLLSGLLYIALRLPPIITSLGVTLIYEANYFHDHRGTLCHERSAECIYDGIYRKLDLCSHYYCSRFSDLHCDLRLYKVRL